MTWCPINAEKPTHARRISWGWERERERERERKREREGNGCALYHCFDKVKKATKRRPIQQKKELKNTHVHFVKKNASFTHERNLHTNVNSPSALWYS